MNNMNDCQLSCKCNRQLGFVCTWCRKLSARHIVHVVSKRGQDYRFNNYEEALAFKDVQNASVTDGVEWDYYSHYPSIFDV